MNECDLSARGPSPASKTGWGTSAAARTDLGSYRLRNYTVREFLENTLGNLQALGTVPNISETNIRNRFILLFDTAVNLPFDQTISYDI